MTESLEEQRALIVSLELELEAQRKGRAILEKRVQALTIEIEHLKRQLFGSKAERVSRIDSQLPLLALLEALGRLQSGELAAGEPAAGEPAAGEPAAGELAAGDRTDALVDDIRDEVDASQDDSKAAKPSKTKPGKKNSGQPHGRRKLEALDLPVERIVLNPVELELYGIDALVQIGEERSFHLDHRPSSIVRVEVVRPKFMKREQEGTAASTAPTEVVDVDDQAAASDLAALVDVFVAPPAELPIPKGMAGPGLLARVLTGKYADHLPLHRQERIFKREGVALSRSTLCGFVQGAVALLAVIVDAMWADSKANAPILLTDACAVLVRASKRHRRAHFQVFIAPLRHILFRYLAEGTGVAIADELKDFRGMLQSDAAATYHETLRREPGVIEVGCWAHGRRKFFVALSEDRERALVGIGFISKLYDAHRCATDDDGVTDGAKRAELSRPILAHLAAWRDRERPLVEKGSTIEVALGYLDRQWAPLTRFLDDGRLRLDNNPSELELRHQVVGRKNWLFCATDSGATWNAVVVSLIASCRIHDIEPWAYLRDVLTVLPAWKASRVLELSPLHWKQTIETSDYQTLLAERRLIAPRRTCPTLTTQRAPPEMAAAACLAAGPPTSSSPSVWRALSGESQRARYACMRETCGTFALHAGRGSPYGYGAASRRCHRCGGARLATTKRFKGGARKLSSARRRRRSSSAIELERPFQTRKDPT
jgi:transposase